MENRNNLIDQELYGALLSLGEPVRFVLKKSPVRRLFSELNAEHTSSDSDVKTGTVLERLGDYLRVGDNSASYLSSEVEFLPPSDDFDFNKFVSVRGRVLASACYHILSTNSCGEKPFAVLGDLLAEYLCVQAPDGDREWNVDKLLADMKGNDACQMLFALLFGPAVISWLCECESRKMRCLNKAMSMMLFDADLTERLGDVSKSLLNIWRKCSDLEKDKLEQFFLTIFCHTFTEWLFRGFCTLEG